MRSAHRPTLRQLEYAVALSEALHFGRAAESLSISQPALSSQIQTLEEILGVALFERTHKGVLLTPPGREVVARAREILRATDDLSAAAKSQLKPLAGELRLGVIPTLAPYVLPRILPGLRRQHSELRLYLREAFTRELLGQLDGGELDVCLLALPVPETHYDHLVLFHDPFLLALPEGDPLAGKREVLESDLDQRDVLLLDDGHCLRDQALEICGRANAGEQSRFRATSLGTLTQMVASGLGLTLLPESTLDVEVRKDGGVEVRRFAGEEPKRVIGLAWRRGSPRAEEYRQLGEEIVQLFDR